MHSEEQYARRAFKAGAAGYITKDSPRAELVRAIDKEGTSVLVLPKVWWLISKERGMDRFMTFFLIESWR